MKFNKQIRVQDLTISNEAPVFIIAEAGLSHFGSEKKAIELVDLAHYSGASAVKFQIFDIDEMYVSSCSEWKQRLAPRQLSFRAFERIKDYCEKLGIIFFATAHDEKSFDFLQTIDVSLHKVGSGEVRNWDYIRKIASSNKPVILSVGMYQPEDIEKVVEIFREALNPNLVILHCVTDYPANPADIALGNIKEMADKFDVLTGYSDHTRGFHIPLGSIIAGAKVIEKHITLEYDIPNAQDWKVSCGPDNLGQFIQQARELELAFSKRVTGPTSNEIENSSWASKSVVLTSDLNSGDHIERVNLITKRPGGGICPSDIKKVVGKKVLRDIKADTVLTWDMLAS